MKFSMIGLSWRCASFLAGVYFMALVTPIYAEPTAAEVAASDHDCGVWSLVALPDGQVIKRHENASIAVGDEIVLLGGRRIQPVQAYNPETGVIRSLSAPPVEMHHFQAVLWNGKVLIAGAMTGPFPGETPVPHVYTYDLESDTWTKGIEIPKDRRRGAAGAVVQDGWVYLVSGIVDGHRSGWVPWFDRFNPDTGEWQRLPDAPHARDHFQAGVLGDQLVAAGGRRSGEDGVFKAVVAEVDVFDLETQTWRTLPRELNIPTPRAGCMAIRVGDELVVAGGETQRPEAFREVEALRLEEEGGAWTAWPLLPEGRHGSQLTRLGDTLWIGSGANARGGRETPTFVRFELCDHPGPATP